MQLGAPVDVLRRRARTSRAAAEAAAKLAGVAKVRVADDALYAHGLAEPLAALLVALAPEYDAILGGLQRRSRKNVLPRAAALLDVMQVSDITKVLGPKTFERPIYAGNAIQTVEIDRPQGRSPPCAPPRSPATGEGGARADRAGRGGGRSRRLELRRRGARASPTGRS